MPNPIVQRALLAVRQIVYLLGPFRFSQDEAAPMVSPHTESGAVGSLTITDTGNKASTATSALILASTTGAGDPRASGPVSFARAAGRALLVNIVSIGAVGQSAWLGFDDNTSGDLNASGVAFDNSIFYITQGGVAFNLGSGVFSVGLGQFLIVLRATGFFVFFRAATTGPYTRMWVSNTLTTSPLYAGISRGGGVVAVNVSRLAALDLGGVWATDNADALNRSTFTAANGTALTAIVPEAGGAWTAQVGTWEIQSNKAVTLSGTSPLATVQSTAANVVTEVTMNRTSSFIYAELILRYTDANNYWVVALGGTNEFSIYEVNAGVTTLRATTTMAITSAVDYRVVAVAEGSTITAYVNNGSKITYASATLNQTATMHGLRTAGGVGVWTFGVFNVWPRTVSLPAGI